MPLIRKSRVSVKFDRSRWEELKKKIGFEDDSKAIDYIINKKEILDKQINELKKKLEDCRKINFESELKLIELKDKILEKKKQKDLASLSDFEVLEKNYKKLSKDYKELKAKYNELIANPRIEEKIVYREDTRILNELKEKIEKLEAKVREKTAKAKKIEEEKHELERKLSSIEKIRANNYGLLVRLDKNINSSSYTFTAEFLNLGEVNKLMRSQRDFLKHKKIKSPSLAILLEEKTDTPRAINLIPNRKKTSLNEISLPAFQYEKLLDFEKNYTIIKEELEELKKEKEKLENNFKDIKKGYNDACKELERLRKNPIIREKIVYKEDTKQIEELKLERDFLRSKLLKLEKAMLSKKSRVEVGEIYKVRIEGVGKNGDCFAKINNLVIFVPNAKPNEEIEIEITKVLKKYGFARIIKKSR